MLTQDRLNERLSYDPETGIFVWKTTRKSCVAGTKAGCVMAKGYIAICVDYHHYLAHRLVFLWETGEFPNGQVDHIDQNRSNNKRNNLRIVLPFENSWNSKIGKYNTSGIKGVSWSKSSNKWSVCLKVRNKKIHIGLFTDKEEAGKAAREARTRLHGEYASH